MVKDSKLLETSIYLTRLLQIWTLVSVTDNSLGSRACGDIDLLDSAFTFAEIVA